VKYLLQVRFHTAPGPATPPSDEEREATRAQYLRIRQDPAVADAHQLEPVGTATTVRVLDGMTERSTGVPIAADAALGGYYLLEVHDLEAAVEFAARIPAAATGGSIEIRPLLG
jgi:hypothetical protein